MRRVTDLRPCARCARHVRGDDTRCPFCGAAIVLARAQRTSTVRATTRAAMFYLGATLAGCERDPGPVPVYGGPPMPPPSEPVVQPEEPNGPQLPEEPAPPVPEPAIAEPSEAPPREEPPRAPPRPEPSVVQAYGAPPDPGPPPSP